MKLSPGGCSVAKQRKDAGFELVDIASYRLPLLDEPTPVLCGHYSREHAKAGSNKIASFDAHVFVTPECNHSTSGALKNAIDYL
jgi:NAD(P)H-dependent FMN reductase